MTSVPPLNVSVSMHKRACVLDVPLALSRYGLLLALRLAQETNVWLVRTLWTVLDHTSFYKNHPAKLFPEAPHAPPDGEVLDETVMALEQWEAARAETDLGGLRVYWAADATQESLFPDDCDDGIVDRFDTLASALDAPAAGYHEMCGVHPRPPDFACESASLAAALTRYRPVVLTRRPADGSDTGEPYLCQFLRRCDIRCERIPDSDRRVVMRSQWLPVLARSGALELLWGGLNVAVVHIVAPHAVCGARMAGHAEQPLEAEAWQSWRQARAFWYPLEV